MTCIVGLETESGVIIGGDSSSSNGYITHSTRLEKVFTIESQPIGEEFLIGYTTSFRMGQLLQYKLKVDRREPREQSALEYLSVVFVDAVRKCLKEGGYAKVENNQEEGGQFLIGYGGILYTVHSDFQVNSSMNGYFAIGAGAEYALGSMWSTKKMKPENRIKRALEAAGQFSNVVKPPYYYQILDK